jgi:hypothetical protein
VPDEGQAPHPTPAVRITPAGLAAGPYPVVQQVACGWPSRATGCDVLYPADVIPGTPLRAVRVKHVDELRSAGGKQLFEPGMADPGALQAALNRHDQVGQAGADHLHRQGRMRLAGREVKGVAVGTCLLTCDGRAEMRDTLVHGRVDPPGRAAGPGLNSPLCQGQRPGLFPV